MDSNGHESIIQEGRNKEENMTKSIKFIIVLLSAVTLLACSNDNSGFSDSTDPGNGSGQSSGVQTTTIQGNVVKGPVEGAEVKLFYFNPDGTETEIAAANAPVVTSTFGAYEFKVNTDDLQNVTSPLIMKKPA